MKLDRSDDPMMIRSWRIPTELEQRLARERTTDERIKKLLFVLLILFVCAAALEGSL